MYPSYPQKAIDSNSVILKFSEIRFVAIMVMVSGVLYYCLYESTALPLVVLTFPLVLYDRAFMFPMFLTITLCQGAFNTAQVTGSGPTQDASYAETFAIMAVTPMLLYDLLTQKSKMIPYRFV